MLAASSSPSIYAFVNTPMGTDPVPKPKCRTWTCLFVCLFEFKAPLSIRRVVYLCRQGTEFKQSIDTSLYLLRDAQSKSIIKRIYNIILYI